MFDSGYVSLEALAAPLTTKPESIITADRVDGAGVLA